MDLEDILDAAGARGGGPCLIEMGRALRADATTTGYFWSTGRIAATVGGGWVRVKRRLGVIGQGDLRLDLAELLALDVACQDWASRRNGWADFYSYPVAPPPYSGLGCVYCYQPAGKASPPVRVGEELRGKLRGERLCGRDEVMPMREPIELASGAHIEAEIWRRGERHGPAEGSVVGCRYRLGADALLLDAERRHAKVSRGDNVWLEAGDEAFVAAILRVVAGDGGQTARAR